MEYANWLQSYDNWLQSAKEQFADDRPEWSTGTEEICEDGSVYCGKPDNVSPRYRYRLGE